MLFKGCCITLFYFLLQLWSFVASMMALSIMVLSLTKILFFSWFWTTKWIFIRKRVCNFHSSLPVGKTWANMARLYCQNSDFLCLLLAPYRDNTWLKRTWYNCGCDHTFIATFINQFTFFSHTNKKKMSTKKIYIGTTMLFTFSEAQWVITY